MPWQRWLDRRAKADEREKDDGGDGAEEERKEELGRSGNKKISGCARQDESERVSVCVRVCLCVCVRLCLSILRALAY